MQTGAPLLAMAVRVLLTLLTLSGLAYSLIALWGARDFVRSWRRQVATESIAPDVTILKPMKGVETRMDAGLRSHCVQQYAGRFELLFGVTSLEDMAVPEIERLRAEFPAVDIRLVECPERLGTSGKVSNLVQMLREAKYAHVVINDSDIEVSPSYLTNVMRGFSDSQVGLVTAPYIGSTAVNGAGRTVWAKLEALGIATDFLPGVLTARKLEGGIRFGLGSTLATTKTAVAKIGGLETLADELADDYMLGYRISQAGYKVQLCGEVVKTTVPAYDFKGFWDHQVRWARTTRDSRKLGYVGLGVTYCLPWAFSTVIASGFALWSFALLSLVLLARVSVALVVGVGVLGDGQVLRDLWLLPVRDVFGLLFWAWSFAGDTVVWRGESFRLKDGRLSRL
ncbi:bacteriohopanetetrol glucosamine biosynthesis glycosyltransferase HpnI [Granulicella aggregans]|uniref:bacteriohopanetetrol glucosamine biosynthesis glycosyltransferase HpnI n=1 Tax=Granulicella aggregans TaxID=474949 RepID=UPI0021E04B1D|nr:bacteriohopanetetrol glucosamine biosynthesis glycosyltransferase HpnI [Granulicella aggregans]